jgi:tripartite-type tricarboxylate transporter receptor subunit TctC
LIADFLWDSQGKLHNSRCCIAAFPIVSLITILALCTIAVRVEAQGRVDTFPNKPLRLIVPFPPGGGNDILARAVGQRLTDVVSQQVIIDNRAGAGGQVGATTAASAAPDGYTMLLGSLGSIAHNSALRPKLPYDPVRDFQAVTLLASSALILVIHPSLPFKSVPEMISFAKAKPGALNHASAGGAGSSSHMTSELFKYISSLNIVDVYYKGTAAAVTDLIGGQVQIMFSVLPPVLPQVKSGKLRALAVTTAKRATVAPEVPTFTESGVQGFEVGNWQGLLVPIKTPREVVLKLNRDLGAALKAPGLSDLLNAQGLETTWSSPEQFSALISSEIAKYRKIVKAANIRID